MADKDYYESSFIFKAVTVVRIVVGVVLTLAVLFAMVWLIDYGERSGSDSLQDQHALLFPERDEDEQDSQPRTLFETLLGNASEKPGGREDPGKTVSGEVPDGLRSELPAVARDPGMPDGGGRAGLPGPEPHPGGVHASHAPAGALFTVQLGSFHEVERARHFSEDIAARGYQPYISMIELPDGARAYRVRVGRFSTREDAMVLATAIEKKERISVFVTTK